LLTIEAAFEGIDSLGNETRNVCGGGGGGGWGWPLDAALTDSVVEG
jgi:hypothetical protein